MAKQTIGAAIALDGEKEFKKAVSSINSNLKVLASEMDKVTSRYSGNGNSLSALMAKSGQYSKIVEVQKTKIKTLHSALENSQKNYAKAGENVEKWKNKLADAKVELDRLKNSGDTTTQKIEEQEKTIAELSKNLETAEKNYVAAENKTKQWQISLNRAETELNKTQGELAQTNAKLKEMGSAAKYSAEQVEAAKNKLKDFRDSAKPLTDAVKTTFKTVATTMATAGVAFAGVTAKSISIGSGFEGQMKKVQAVSGASQQEYENLKNKAEEMGSKTKFTATQAGEALEYMSMAGWKTKDMISGLDSIMNLAAASGEDLGTTSDIVTDALTAFGLKAEDSRHFADILAAASSNANTNVSMMGETFKYVAPIAGSLGISTEDTAEAIGLLANQGIKGSQAGTYLRNILTRLSTDAGASSKSLGALGILTKDLGVDFYDSRGKVRDFGDILTEARAQWKKLGDEDASIFAKKIAGQEGISAWLALMNSSTDDIAKLHGAIENCDGAAKKMADTMQDNLNGQLTILKSGMEGTAIDIYNELQKPLTDTVKTAVSSLNNPQVKNGTKSVAKQFGEMMGNFSKYAAGHIPTFIRGFQKVTSYLSSPSFKSTVKSAGSLFDASGKVIVSVGKVSLPPIIKGFELLAKSGKVLIPVLAGTYTGFKAFQIIKTVTDLAGKANGAFAALNVVMAANPYAVVAAAIVAVTIALVGLVAQGKKTEDKYVDLCQEIDNTAQSMKEMAEARKESYNAAYSEIYEVEKLKDKLGDLVDENGNVIGSKEDLKSTIKQLNEKGFDVELSKTGDLIKNYQDLSKEIDDYIEKKEVQAKLDALDSEYQNAEVNKGNLHAEVIKAQKAYDDEVNSLNKKMEEERRPEGFYEEELKSIENLAKEREKAVKNEENALKLIDAVGEASKLFEAGKYNEANKELDGFLDDRNTMFKRFSDCEKVQRAQMIGELGQQLIDEISVYQTALDSGGKELIDSSIDYTQKAADELEDAGVDIPDGLVEGIKNGETSVEEAMQTISEIVKENSKIDISAQAEAVIDTYAQGIDMSKPIVGAAADSAALAAAKEFASQNAKDEAAQSGKDTDSAFAGGIENSESTITKAAKAVAFAGASAMVSQSIKTRAENAGKATGEGFKVGLDSTKKKIIGAATGVVSAALAAMRKEADINSPSKKTRDLVGKPMGVGVGVGIEMETASVTKKAAASINSIINSMQAQTSQAQTIRQNYNYAVRKFNEPRSPSANDMPMDTLKSILSGSGRPNVTVNYENTFNSATARDGEALLRQFDRALGAKI